MLGTGGKRPNGFIFIQWLCEQAHGLPLAPLHRIEDSSESNSLLPINLHVI